MKGGLGKAGLSPRVRGKPDRDARLVRCRGSIPACAGEAEGYQTNPATLEVYPRVCGGSGRKP